MITIFRAIEVGDFALDVIHDRVFDVFGVDVTVEQIVQLLALDDNYDGSDDSMSMSELINTICQHFIGMDVPMYGSPQDYQDEFWVEAKKSKKKVIAFLNPPTE